MDNAEAPGVTFHLDKATMLPPSKHKPMKARARVLLTAEIYNEEVWEQVVKKLDNGGNGMRIYTVTDFAVEMVEVMKTTHEKEKKQLGLDLVAKDAKIAQLDQQLSFARAEAKMVGEARDMALNSLKEYKEEAEQQGMDRDLIM